MTAFVLQVVTSFLLTLSPFSLPFLYVFILSEITCLSPTERDIDVYI